MRRKSPKATKTYNRDADRILAANSIFYSAFSTLNYPAMEDLWLPDNTSICIFPNSRPLRGSSAILKSWKHAVEFMSGNDLRNWMTPDRVRFEYIGTNRATLVCDELIFCRTQQIVAGRQIEHTEVVNKFRARNMFKKVRGRWYLCYHEAIQIKPVAPVMPPVNDAWTIISDDASTVDSRQTFLTLMTTERGERKRDRRRQQSSFSRFINYWNCSCT